MKCVSVGSPKYLPRSRPRVYIQEDGGGDENDDYYLKMNDNQFCWGV